MNICGALSSGIAALQVLGQIDWRLFRRVTIAAAIFIPAGGVTILFVDSVILQLMIGIIVLLALILPSLLFRFRTVRLGRNADLVAGAFVGYMNCVAGIGGPALMAYSVLSKWDFRSFRATAQPTFFVVGILSFIARLILGVDAPGSDSFALLLPFMLTTVVGSVAGTFLARVVRPAIARIMSLAIAALGALAVLIDALLQMM